MSSWKLLPGLLVDENRLSTTVDVDKTSKLSISESLLMIVYKIWKLTNEVRVRLARDKGKDAKTTSADGNLHMSLV